MNVTHVGYRNKEKESSHKLFESIKEEQYLTKDNRRLQQNVSDVLLAHQKAKRDLEDLNKNTCPLLIDQAIYFYNIPMEESKFHM